VCELRRARDGVSEGARRWRSHGGRRQPGGVGRRARLLASIVAH
jgi:hypothetical protein